jgi:hypothetical protein
MLEALDYAQIQNVLNLYPFIVDVPENYGRAGEVFTEDGVFDSGQFGRHEGVAALIEYWSHSPTRAAALEKSQLLAHNMANIHIFEDTDGIVRCYSRCVGVSKTGVATVAVYHDIMRKTPDGWRIAYRKLMPMEAPTVTLR